MKKRIEVCPLCGKEHRLYTAVDRCIEKGVRISQDLLEYRKQVKYESVVDYFRNMTTEKREKVFQVLESQMTIHAQQKMRGKF